MPDSASSQPVSSHIPPSAAPFFQEYRFSDLDAEKDAYLVMERIFAFGNREELKWLFHFYGEEKIRDWVNENGLRRLPYRRYNMWRTLLGLPRRDKLETGGVPDSPIENAWQHRMDGFPKRGNP